MFEKLDVLRNESVDPKDVFVDQVPLREEIGIKNFDVAPSPGGGSRYNSVTFVHVAAKVMAAGLAGNTFADQVRSIVPKASLRP